MDTGSGVRWKSQQGLILDKNGDAIPESVLCAGY